MPLISDLVMELESGRRVTLPQSFALPPGLPGVGSEENGDAAPDSLYVVRSGDELPQAFSVTTSGKLHATSAVALLDKYEKFCADVGQCRKVWMGGRYYLDVQYGVVGQPDMGFGWLSCKVVVVFRLNRRAWFRADGTPAFGQGVT